MTFLIILYAWTIPAGMFFAATLALLGAHLAARDRAMQTVCISQGAMLGVLIAMGLSQTVVHEDPDSHLFPFVFSILVSALTFIATNALSRRRQTSKNTFFAAVFALLLASGYLVSALFPALESHMAQVYFGDLATLTEFDSKLTLALGLAGLVGLIGLWRPISNHSFELATFGESLSSRSAWLWNFAFHALTLSFLCMSVQLLGFLFTVAALFLPTTILNFSSSAGLLRHLILSAIVAATGAMGGFLASLAFTRLPTVPSITLAIFLLGLLVVAVSRVLTAGRLESRRQIQEWR